MRTVKSVRASEQDAENGDDLAFDAYDADTYEIYRVNCPDCGQPIALLAEEEMLPEHALCATRWDPFGLTVCPGSGRAAADAVSSGEEPETQERDVAALLTLPEGLDWRKQPFSHVGGPSARPIRVPGQTVRAGVAARQNRTVQPG
ncbi:hypothetical protein [Streptomyces daliensis]|uniref:Uncharacterized protein n=1 Tax=Streptomyces daliensis TaxID=299421 RepID=A0A8T4J1L2_9ACTN|nr:hypothetical protein [Streptomyces daliensis]